MKYFFVAVISLTLSGAGYSSPFIDPVKEIATDIAKQNTYESAIVGFAATPSTQNERLDKLIKIASVNQLYELCKHENAVVRLYALKAILFRKLIVTDELRHQFYNDNSKVITLQGCIGNYSTVEIISRSLF